MSDWSLEVESQFDVMGPSDPACAPPDEETPDAGGSAPAPGGSSVDADGALTDASGAVHVWLDDEQRVARLRVSNRWRERLKDASLADTLVSLVGGYQPMSGVDLSLEQASEPVDPRPLSSEALDALLERTLELDDKRAKLAQRSPDEVTPTRMEGASVEGRSANRMVSVTLAAHGATIAVTLDDDWLPRAKAEDLGNAVMEAYRDAYAQWRPPTVALGDWARLAAEGDLLQREAMAMLARGAR